MRSCGSHSRRDPERARVRGVPEDRFALGTSAPVPDLRPCRVLRRLSEPARNTTLPGDTAPGHRRLRPTRGLGLALYRRGYARSERVLMLPRFCLSFLRSSVDGLFISSRPNRLVTSTQLRSRIRAQDLSLFLINDVFVPDPALPLGFVFASVGRSLAMLMG